MVRYLAAFIAMTLAAMAAGANDLKELYELALTRDASLQAAGFQRDAAIESRPQALAQWLPQVSASASAARERQGFDSGQLGNAEAADCALTAAAGMQHCYGTVHGLGLNLSQTLWSFQAFSQLKEANFAGGGGGGRLPGSPAESPVAR